MQASCHLFRLSILFAALLAPSAMWSQVKTCEISGLISDATGALIPGATITLAGADGREQTVSSDALGRYSFQQLAAGRYVLRVSAPAFSDARGLIVNAVSGHSITHNVQLQIAVVEQQVEVLAAPVIDTQPESNASAITLNGTALQAVSDDQDDLAQDLQLLAGPSTGPEGRRNFC